MSNFELEYRQKLAAPEDILAMIRSGDVIIAGGSALEPQCMLSRLHELRGRVENITCMVALGITPYPFMTEPQYADTFRVPTNFMQGAGRKAHSLGIGEFLPADLDNGCSFWNERNDPDWCFIQSSSMNERGEFCISLSLLRELEDIACAKRVVLEVNPNVPWVNGEGIVKLSQVDYILEVDNPLPIVPSAKVGPVERQIAENIASLIRDGDTIQFGIGSIPDATAALLMDRHDLGIHTEMFTNSMRNLVEAGVVTNKKKTLDTGRTVATFAMGTQETYDMLASRDDVFMRRGHYVNSPFVIARQDNFVSVNNALCVDLGGQVCSESIGPRMYSGSGGQFDTAFGAFHSKGGRGIIALRSTANTKQGRISTINALLAPGSVITLGRNYVDYIVTEYGAAHLRGLTVRDRAKELIRIAHPDFREELRRDAEKFMLW